MEDVFDLLMMLLPAVIVFLTAFYLIKRFLDSDHARRKYDLKKESHKTILPLRLQAYERIVLYLERISPHNIIMRIHKPGMTARTLQSELVKAIREEFEHNMVQQVYVSDQSWVLVKKAKEETVNIINISAGKMKEGASGVDLSTEIFSNVSKMKELPSEIAARAVKSELRKLF